MRDINNPMLVTFDNLPKEKRWNACMSAIETEYTLSFKDICKILKCSRSWANRYIKPHLHYVYLSNGAEKGPNYVRLARKCIEEEFTECNRYSKKEFEKLILDNITEITRQTINVPVEDFIEDDTDKINFIQEYKELNNNIKNAKNKDAILLLLGKRDKLLKTSINDKTLYKNIIDSPNKYARTETKACKCNLSNINIFNLEAVHDLKDYGDIDEEIYRMLFEEGYYKITLSLPDADGVLSKKIYYYKPKDIFKTKDSVWMLPIKYSNFLKYTKSNK